jgi:predicted O-linked N-acetylglucosamine transferase (SPINDLY family)
VATPYEDWLQRGRVHQWEGRPVDALLCFQRAAAINPNAVDPRFLIGEVQWQIGAIPAAVAAWREAARIAPRHVGSQLALAEASLVLGDLPGAADAAEAALALDASNLDARVLRAVAAFASGRDAHALRDLADAVGSGVSRLASPAVGGVLARSLEGAEPAAHDALVAALVPHASDLAFALLPFLAEREDARPVVAATALERAVTPGEVDALREVALVFAQKGPQALARDLAQHYAQACIAFTAPGPPLRWPRRTAGKALRVSVIVPVNDAGRRKALALLQGAPLTVEVAWTLLVAGSTPSIDFPAIVRSIGTAPDAGVAAALASDDPDLLLDLAGLNCASGPLIAARPAQSIAGVALDEAVHGESLIDEAIPADGTALSALLAREFARAAARTPSPLEGSALNELFASAVEAHRAGDRVAARQGYERVLEAQPEHARTLHLMASLCREEGDHERARGFLGDALRLAPDFIEARVAAARIARDRGAIAEGLTLIEEGLSRQPRSEPLWRVRGELELARHDGVAAEAAFANALAIKPIDAEAHYNLGVALQKQGRRTDAARAYQRALVFDPRFADAHFNLGVLFTEQGHPAAAVSAWQAVLDRDPRRVAAWRNLGEALLAAGRIDEWLANFRRFEAQCPNALPLAVHALEACHYAADQSGLERYLDGLRHERFQAADAHELVDALEELAYLLLFFDAEPEMPYRFARTYASVAPSVYGDPLTLPAMRKPGKLRIGYLSADFRDHVMGKMMWQALQHHDRDRFAVFCYSLSRVRDAWTDRFASISQYETVASLADRDASLRIAADDLDVLVDLSGHTKGGRPGILALKPARVQITHVASAGSVGLSAIDFKLTDAYADVPANQETMIETLLPMEGCVYPWRPVTVAETHGYHRQALGVAADAIVIGAFVTPLKLSRRCLALWREVLDRIPRALLAFSPNHPALRPVFERLCAAAGIARERLVFVAQGGDDAKNQARYTLVDFVLDPMPFGGVNGVLEPLAAGVPVVALVGRRHGERSAYSILRNLGVTDTVANSGREYVEIAVRLAQDRTFMQSVRGAIAQGMRSSPLVDMPAHTRNLEAAYIEALRQKAPGVLDY